MAAIRADNLVDRYDSFCCACWLETDAVVPWQMCDTHHDVGNPTHTMLANNRQVFLKCRWDDHKKKITWRGKPDFCSNCGFHESEHAKRGRCLTQPGTFTPNVEVDNE